MMHKAWPGMGMNIGNWTSQSGWTVQQAIDFLHFHGVNTIRIVYHSADAVWKARAVFAQTYAKSLGMYVISGTSSVGSLTSANYATHQAANIAEALEAQARGVDEWQIDNEAELRIDHVTILDPYALMALWQKPHATAAKAAGITMKLTVAWSAGAQSWIYNITKGDLFGATFNVYGETTLGTFNKFVDEITAFKANANWGDTLTISEFNTTYDNAESVRRIKRPDFYTREVARRIEAIKEIMGEDTTACFFCFRYDTQNYHSVLQDDGGLGQWINPIITNNQSKKIINSVW